MYPPPQKKIFQNVMKFLISVRKFVALFCQTDKLRNCSSYLNPSYSETAGHKCVELN
jgi:hypothetical protein